ncbi:MAG: glycosyltransferase family 4 protein [Pseudorhodoplanes sp.]
MNAGLKRAAFRAAIGAGALATLPLRARDSRVAVFYGGAKAGQGGGPLVKVQLLQQRFPEYRVGYSLLYILSGSIYLPQAVIERIQASGVPVVLNQNGVFYRRWYPKGWERENARMAGVHAAADHVFYQSAFCRRCAELFLGPRNGPAEILHNAVDTTHFVPAARNRPAGATRFLLTGKIGPATAYRLMSSIEGIAYARRQGLDVHLSVAGMIDRQVAAQAQSLAGRLGAEQALAYLGPYDFARAPSVYQTADAYLITKHNDPCPNVVLEAMASGLPVLYSASGGVPELVGDEAGIGLPVPETFDDDPVPAPAALADGMARIIALKEEMGAAARARAVASFELRTWLDRHADVFQRLVDAAA